MCHASACGTPKTMCRPARPPHVRRGQHDALVDKRAAAEVVAIGAMPQAGHVAEAPHRRVGACSGTAAGSVRRASWQAGRQQPQPATCCPAATCGLRHRTAAAPLPSHRRTHRPRWQTAAGCWSACAGHRPAATPAAAPRHAAPGPPSRPRRLPAAGPAAGVVFCALQSSCQPAGTCTGRKQGGTCAASCRCSCSCHLPLAAGAGGGRVAAARRLPCTWLRAHARLLAWRRERRTARGGGDWWGRPAASRRQDAQKDMPPATAHNDGNGAAPHSRVQPQRQMAWSQVRLSGSRRRSALRRRQVGW